jgi:thioredoxin 1
MMKKIAFLLCIGLLTLVLQGACGNDDNKKSSNTTTKEEKKPADIKVTFVELGSVRCIPCKKMQPIMEEIKKEYEGQVKVVFHDVWTEEGRPFAYQFRIRVIPTQVFLDKDGNEYFRHEGFFPKEELVKILKQKGVK